MILLFSLLLRHNSQQLTLIFFQQFSDLILSVSDLSCRCSHALLLLWLYVVFSVIISMFCQSGTLTAPPAASIPRSLMLQYFTEHRQNEARRWQQPYVPSTAQGRKPQLRDHVTMKYESRGDTQLENSAEVTLHCSLSVCSLFHDWRLYRKWQTNNSVLTGSEATQTPSVASKSCNCLKTTRRNEDEWKEKIRGRKRWCGWHMWTDVW